MKYGRKYFTLHLREDIIREHIVERGDEGRNERRQEERKEGRKKGLASSSLLHVTSLGLVVSCYYAIGTQEIAATCSTIFTRLCDPETTVIEHLQLCTFKYSIKIICWPLTSLYTWLFKSANLIPWRGTSHKGKKKLHTSHVPDPEHWLLYQSCHT